MELVSIEENKNNLVNKHQELVRNARYSLSNLGIKIVSVLISMVKVSDEDFKEYLIKVSDFKELIGSTSKNTYEYVDVMTDELMKKPFKIGDEKFNWVYYAKYKEGESAVILKIAPELKPYLLALKNNFLQYNIANILALKSAYVIRLYELCKDHFAEGTRYKKDLKSVVFDMKIDRLRELFEIPESYQYSSHIKKHILNKAVEQFKEKTDIQISYAEQKIGRKVDRIIITVRSNDKGSNDFLAERKVFISYMRKNYVNADVLEAKDKNTGRVIKVSVAPDGKLYDKRGGEFDKERSNEMWDTLFEMAKNDTLYCLKQGSLFEQPEQPEQAQKKPEQPQPLNPKSKSHGVTIHDLAFSDVEEIGEQFLASKSELEHEFRLFKNYSLSKNKLSTRKRWAPLFMNWLLNGKKFVLSPAYDDMVEDENFVEPKDDSYASLNNFDIDEEANF